ncbi:MAG TPA: autotransporter-associated beta strand repeat-containing protein, partial [Candidatus Acidoferrum sp.]|nr:autotransporter-associated beta strand repeat-containing protein [Candidatus Acidoferrum sp.]
WSASESIDTPTNGNLTLGGNINSSADTSLIKLDAGTLTLGGTNAIVSWDLDGGTTTITGNTTINGDGSSRIYVGNGDAFALCNGKLVIQPGAVLDVIGSYADDFVIGRDGGSGTVVQNGGTFIFNNNRQNMWIGATGNAATRSEYDMNGGLLDMSGNTLGVGLGAGVLITGVVNQVSGVITNVGNLWLGGATPNGYGAYNLSGGSIYIGTNVVSGTSGITTFSGLYAVNLGGGTIGAETSWTSPLNMTLTGSNGPVSINTGGNSVTLSGALSGSGGLTKNGAGTLEVSSSGNSYTGDTTVIAGTLQLDAYRSTLASMRITNGATLNLNYSGAYSVAHFYTNNVSLPNGTYNAGNIAAFITGTGALQVGDIAFTNQPQNQLVYLNGNYHQSVTLTSGTAGAPATYQWYLNGNPVAGATNSSLTLSNLQITNAGNFYVVATSDTGSITSSVVAVTIYGVNNNVFVYEGFAYPGSVDDSTPIDGTSQNGGTGWSGPWVGAGGTTGNTAIGLGSLIGGTNVPAGFDSSSISNSLEDFGGSRVGRFFDTSTSSQLYIQGFVDANGNVGADGKKIYLSFLQQPLVTSGGAFYELEFKKDNLGDPGRIGGIGNDTETGNANLRAGGVNNYSLGAGDTNIDFYVVRIDYKAGNDDVFVYRNPTSLTEPAIPTMTVSNAADMSFNGLSVAAFNNGAALNVDEIRLGATWDDAIGLAVSNLLPPTKTVNGYTVQFACTPGHSYRIQRAVNLTGPWTDLIAIIAPANGFVIYQDTAAPSGKAFYRTVTP